MPQKAYHRLAWILWCLLSQHVWYHKAAKRKITFTDLSGSCVTAPTCSRPMLRTQLGCSQSSSFSLLRDCWRKAGMLIKPYNLKSHRGQKQIWSGRERSSAASISSCPSTPACSYGALWTSLDLLPLWNNVLLPPQQTSPFLPGNYPAPRL